MWLGRDLGASNFSGLASELLDPSRANQLSARKARMEAV